MGRPKGGKNAGHSKEEKLRLVLRNLEGGEEALANKRKPPVQYRLEQVV